MLYFIDHAPHRGSIFQLPRPPDFVQTQADQSLPLIKLAPDRAFDLRNRDSYFLSIGHDAFSA